MNRLLASIIAAVSFFPPLATAAEAMTVGDLQQICAARDPESKGACRFYVLGVLQGIQAGMNIADGKTDGGRPCIPDNVPSSALEIFVKAKIGEILAVYPDDRSLDASGFVAAMIVTRFRCPRATGK